MELARNIELELIRTAMAMINLSAAAAAEIEDEVTRHEVLAYLLGAFGQLSTILQRAGYGQGRLGRTRLRELAARPELAVDFALRAERFLAHARSAAEAKAN